MFWVIVVGQLFVSQVVVGEALFLDNLLKSITPFHSLETPPLGLEAFQDSLNASSVSKVLDEFRQRVRKKYDSLFPAVANNSRHANDSLWWQIFGSSAPSHEASKNQTTQTEYNRAVGKSEGEQVHADDLKRPTSQKSQDRVPHRNTTGLPAAALLENLRCHPEVSFASCVNHCSSILHLPDPHQKGINRMLAEQSKAEKSARAKTSDAKAIRDSLQADGSLQSVALTAAELTQFKLCVYSICVVDYLVKPVPGCLGPDGAIIPIGQTLPLDREVIWKSFHADPSPYKELDFYNPSRVHFYKDTGLFKLNQIWRNIVPEGSSIFTLLTIPVWILSIGLIFPSLLFWGYWTVVNFWVESNSDQGPENVTRILTSKACGNVKLNFCGTNAGFPDSGIPRFSDHAVWRGVQYVANGLNSLINTVVTRGPGMILGQTNVNGLPFADVENPALSTSSSSLEMTNLFIQGNCKNTKNQGYYVIPSEPEAASPAGHYPN